MPQKREQSASKAKDARPEPSVLAPRLGAWWATAALGLLTVAGLTVSFAPWNAWPLAYVALVPWTVAVAVGARRRRTLALATAAGAVFWAINLYWLTWVTPLGYAAGGLYLTVYWLIAAVALRAMLRRGWPAWVVVPVVWTALEYVRAHVIGFPWFFLAHSQYAQTSLIQIADLTGQYGLSFVVGMINGVGVDAALWALRRRQPGRTLRPVVAGAVASVCAIAGLLGYGGYRLSQQAQSPGPVVGIVQQAVATTLRGPAEDPVEILDGYLAESRIFTGQGCDLVVWPETVLLAGMNQAVLAAELDTMPSPKLRALARWFARPLAEGPRATDEQLREMVRPNVAGRNLYAGKVAGLSARLKCPILAGGTTLHYTADGSGAAWMLRNSALWFDESPAAEPIYSKRLLVPFSEYVPFRASAPWLHRCLRFFVPGVMAQVEPGREWTRFDIQRGRQSWRLAVPICYEGTFARAARSMVIADGQKTADMLVNISNDGWFVRCGRLSAEHAQHLVAYRFRAVENRVPVIRSVNTGISASIDSNGRVVAMLAGSDGAGAGSRMRAGRMLLTGSVDGSPKGVTCGPQVLVDSRVSVYSLQGDVFVQVVGVAALALCMLAWLRRGRESETSQ
ncbi:MAG: apolipoprotein N-acyltransferase [Planctomycetota bacterium]|jgi:apolipoprotein N-acyltransferase